MIPFSQDPAYHRLKDYLIKSTGLAFYEDRDEQLTELIGGRLTDLGLSNCCSYEKLLFAGAKGSAEMERLIAQLTIGETYFFRDEEQFTAIREIVLPDILERNRPSKVLRIWSAGCATGAEPYSLAILLAREMASQIVDWKISICATDLNRSYLAQASEGKFRAWALRGVSDEVKRDCFSNVGRHWVIHPRHKQWIQFQHMNLAGNPFSTPFAEDTHFDLILCRNVMIYFTPEGRRRLIGGLHDSLEDHGWLVVGASEHHSEGYKAFRSANVSGATLYQKVPLPRGPIEKAVEPGPLRITAAPGPPVEPLIKSAPAPDPPDMKSLRQLADRGDWKIAAEYGQRLLDQDRLNPAIHFYQALIFENLGMTAESERSLRQALYLDRNFALAHYHLGLALKRDRRTRGSARSFGNVLRVLGGVPDDAVIEAGPGVTVTALKELAKMHLESLSGS